MLPPERRIPQVRGLVEGAIAFLRNPGVAASDGSHLAET